MGSLINDPMVWIGVGAIILLVIVISLIIGRRRKKELEELDQLFTDERKYDDTDKISVEKVRRATLEREKRMEARRKELEQRKPRKVIPDEDQEIITNVEIIEEEPPITNERKTPLRGNRNRSDDTLEVNMTTKIVTIDSGNDDSEAASLSASRRLYKKNVLNPMSSGDPNQQQTSPKGTPRMNNGFINKSTKRR